VKEEIIYWWRRRSSLTDGENDGDGEEHNPYAGSCASLVPRGAPPTRRYYTPFILTEGKKNSRSLMHDFGRSIYSLGPILPFTNMDISSTKRYLDTSIFAKDNMSRREYQIIL
jgi:hypothetical protein